MAVETRESSENAVLQITSFLTDVARMAATHPGKNVEVEVRLFVCVVRVRLCASLCLVLCCVSCIA